MGSRGAAPEVNVPSFVVPDLEKIGTQVAPDRLELCARFLDLLLDENTRQNLTGITEPDEMWRRHVIDAFTLLPHLKDVAAGKRVVDVGSGGGVPGIPLAIARPDLRVTLVEATLKKARFLESALVALALDNVVVRAERAETVGREREHRQAYDVAICRALGPMRELLEYTLPLVKAGGFLLAMKGRDVAGELAESKTASKRLGGHAFTSMPAYPPSFEVATTIVRVDKAHPTPAAYPRRPGIPRKEPL